jgi:hypothetical protein
MTLNNIVILVINLPYIVLAILILVFLFKERNYEHVKLSIAQILIKGFNIDLWITYLLATILVFIIVVIANAIYTTLITRALISALFIILEIVILVYVYEINRGLKA